MAVNEIPEAGRHVELVADENARKAIAQAAELRELPRLAAAFDVTRRGRDGLQVVGQVSATVGQTCVVTLEPMENEVEEAIDLVFAPSAMRSGAERDLEIPVKVGSHDAPEPLSGGTVDLGAIATEFLLLGIDPYPRKPGAVFEPPKTDDERDKPFAALAALKKRLNDNPE